jgi:hypothetical protein
VSELGSRELSLFKILIQYKNSFITSPSSAGIPHSQNTIADSSLGIQLVIVAVSW